MADRLLWALQILLILAALGLAALAIAPWPAPSTATPTGCEWTYYYEGEQVTAAEAHCTGQNQTEIGPLWIWRVVLALVALWTAAFGATLFCLRRLGDFLRR